MNRLLAACSNGFDRFGEPHVVPIVQGESIWLTIDLAVLETRPASASRIERSWEHVGNAWLAEYVLHGVRGGDFSVARNTSSVSLGGLAAGVFQPWREQASVLPRFLEALPASPDEWIPNVEDGGAIDVRGVALVGEVLDMNLDGLFMHATIRCLFTPTADRRGWQPVSVVEGGQPAFMCMQLTSGSDTRTGVSRQAGANQ